MKDLKLIDDSFTRSHFVSIVNHDMPSRVDVLSYVDQNKRIDALINSGELLDSYRRSLVEKELEISHEEESLSDMACDDKMDMIDNYRKAKQSAEEQINAIKENAVKSPEKGTESGVVHTSAVSGMNKTSQDTAATVGNSVKSDAKADA